ncbi:MAG: hypothetical protein WBA74_10745 [Cyclobacteriaceae bacterium]
MKTHADFDNAVSFDDLLEAKNQMPKQGHWVAMIGDCASLLMERPTALQDNTPLNLE